MDQPPRYPPSGNPDTDPLNDRRAVLTPVPSVSPSPILLAAVVAMTLIGVSAVLVIGIFAPDRASVLIAQVVALLVPTTAALLAVLKSSQNSQAIQNVHLSLNGRLEQLLRVTAASQRAEGNIEGARKVLDASGLAAAQVLTAAATAQQQQTATDQVAATTALTAATVDNTQAVDLNTGVRLPSVGDG